MRLAVPEVLIAFRSLRSYAASPLPEGVRIGGLTRHVDVQRTLDVAKHVPLVAAAIGHVGHVVVRNRGIFVNADPAAVLPACALALQATGRRGPERNTPDPGDEHRTSVPHPNARRLLQRRG
ncbi:MAG: FAD binding domain-containing protein [Acetobacteraceae bacterium]|nr:FAD binding domain-containing protein [Acetobacteraceae bacterium]